MSTEFMMIDNMPVEIAGEQNILAVIRKAGIELPTFCYYSELSVYGACRMCVVEDKSGEIHASCSTPPQAGMEIRTNTPRLRKYRKMILELLLANHCRDCTTCEKNGKCKLQDLAMRFNIEGVRFPNTAPQQFLSQHLKNRRLAAATDTGKYLDERLVDKRLDCRDIVRSVDHRIASLQLIVYPK